MNLAVFLCAVVLFASNYECKSLVEKEKKRAIDEIPCTEYLPDGTCCPCGKTTVHPWPSGHWECYPKFNDRCCPDYALLTTRIVTSEGTHWVTEFQCCECGASVVDNVKMCNQKNGTCCEAYLPDGTCCPCGKKEVLTNNWQCYPLHNGQCCPDYLTLIYIKNGRRVIEHQCCECGASFVNRRKVCNPKNSDGQC